MNEFFSFLASMANAIAGLALIFGLMGAYLVYWKVAGKEQAEAKRTHENTQLEGQKTVALAFQASSENMKSTAHAQREATDAMGSLLTEHRNLLDAYHKELVSLRSAALVKAGG